MQTRYYNPSYGRFLNADTTEILERTKGTVLGANIFAYCNNNPVMNVDYEGEGAFLAGAATGTVLVFILFLAISSAISGKTIQETFEDWRTNNADAYAAVGVTIQTWLEKFLGV